MSNNEFDMIDELHDQSMWDRMEPIMNTHWEDGPRDDPREVEVFEQAPRPEHIPWNNPAACFDELD
jgi:hypothetical protein